MEGVSFGVCLPKHYAEAGRTSLYEGYFYFIGSAGPSQGAARGDSEEEEEFNDACREKQHHIRKRDESFPTASGQAKGQRASNLARLHRARQQAPKTGRCTLASARNLISCRLLSSVSNLDHPG